MIRSNTRVTGVLALAVISLAASEALAASTVCSYVTATTVTPITSSTTLMTPTMTIAVASNFYAPAQKLVKEFLIASSSYATVGVCHNATGHLMAEVIDPADTTLVAYYGSHPYDAAEYLSNYIGFVYAAMLGANAKAAGDLATSGVIDYVTGSNFRYAYGIPALYTNNAKTGRLAADLVTYDANGPVGYYSATTSTGPVEVDNSNVLKLAIGNPALAPYGAKAQTILTAMGQWATPYSMGSDYLSDCPPSPMSPDPWACMYDNIDITQRAIDEGSNNIDAGFISWAQICTGSPEFVTFPNYKLDQQGVLLETDAVNGVNSEAETMAQSLFNYMNPGSAAWNSWLNAACYGSI